MNIQLDASNRRAYDNLDKAAAEFAAAMGRAQNLVGDHQQRREVLRQLAELREKQRGIHERVVGMVSAGEFDAARALTNADETPTWRAMRELLLKEIEATKVAAGAAKTAVVADARAAERLVVGLAIAAVLLGVGLSLAVVASVTRTLDSAVVMAEQIAKGDLAGNQAPAARNEVGRLVGAMDRMRTRLRAMIERTSGSATAVEPGCRRSQPHFRTDCRGGARPERGGRFDGRGRRADDPQHRARGQQRTSSEPVGA
ncbi:MAG: methyl-accepting chemotaxis protein [Candidatus Accumulibacter sp.]|uniref:HAMP domain-containing protein n=1 Tax=Accumulibacter sp. TaxID=2053492 RepID=UPI00258D0E73|nr:HAMP domain-containing protein [Accumulibacter sp.]MBK8113994.1 methyl-accepting chemotaxis protein [Accumulibacter sp.]